MSFFLFVGEVSYFSNDFGAQMTNPCWSCSILPGKNEAPAYLVARYSQVGCPDSYSSQLDALSKVQIPNATERGLLWNPTFEPLSVSNL